MPNLWLCKNKYFLYNIEIKKFILKLDRATYAVFTIEFFIYQSYLDKSLFKRCRFTHSVPRPFSPHHFCILLKKKTSDPELFYCRSLFIASFYWFYTIIQAATRMDSWAASLALPLLSRSLP